MADLTDEDHHDWFEILADKSCMRETTLVDRAASIYLNEIEHSEQERLVNNIRRCAR